ncbi:MAG: ABC transporter substrate-binding protein [Herminiimonas sp.]|nr:ABC transporter substrate-binding protein [Herminiimonas sp.]
MQKNIWRCISALFFLTLAQGTFAQEIVIGQAAPLTGVLADTGKDMVLGGKIYFDYINSQGGIHGHKIRHVVLDDGYVIDNTLAATKQLIAQEHAVALFGYAGTGNILRLLDDKVLSDAKIALVGPYTGGEPLRNPYNPNIFHIRAGYGDETAAMVKQLTISGVTRVGVMYQDDAFGKAGLKGVVDALAIERLKPVATAGYVKNTDDVAAAVSTIAASDPQAIILISVNKSSAAFIKQYRALKKSGIIFNISVVNPAVLAKLVDGPQLRGVRITQVVPDPVSGVLPVAKEYQKILQRFGNGAAPSYTSFEEFLAAKVLVEGLKRAKNPMTRTSVIDALESLDSLDLGGFTIRFGAKNRIGSSYVDTMVINKDGKMLR